MPLSTERILPDGRTVRFMDRHSMKRGHPVRRFKLPDWPAPSLPIDWARKLVFPIDDNDTYGDCMYAMACHGDQTFTGCNGAESSFDSAVILKDYLALSGGDNGLDEGQIVGAWKQGIASTSAATILDALDIDPTQPQLMQAAIGLFGGVCFMLDVPDPWVDSFHPGMTWTTPATADANNGHGVWINGVDPSSAYHVQTWGDDCWLTPAGVDVCDPSAFVVFSMRWFNAEGIAPNGLHYEVLARLWHEAGGIVLPPSPFPPAPPSPAPTPLPPPLPSPVPPNPYPPPVDLLVTVDVTKQMMILPPGYQAYVQPLAPEQITIHLRSGWVAIPPGWHAQSPQLVELGKTYVRPPFYIDENERS